MIRFNNSKNADFTPYDAGTYDLQIESVEQGASKNGNPQLTVKCRFVGGKYDGKQITSWYSLLEQSQWKLSVLVEATGCPHTVVGHGPSGDPLVEFDEADLVGRIFTADVTISEYNGRKNNRIDKERVSDLAPQDEPQDEPPAPTPPPPVSKPVATTQTMARRPRTVGQ